MDGELGGEQQTLNLYKKLLHSSDARILFLPDRIVIDSMVRVRETAHPLSRFAQSRRYPNPERQWATFAGVTQW